MIRTRLVTTLAGALALHCGSLTAADFIVTRYDDPSPDGCLESDCSLREAIGAANQDPAFDRILLSAGRYLLSIEGLNEDDNATGDLDVRSDLEIVGVGARLTILDGDQVDRVLHVTGAFVDEVRLLGLGIRGGRGDGAVAGAGIAAASGVLRIEECELRENGRLLGGGGLGDAVFVTVGGNVELVKSTLAANFGSGLRVNQGHFSAENSTFSSNLASEILLLNGATGSCHHCTLFDSGPSGAVNLNLQGADTVLEISNSIVVASCNIATGAALESLGGNLEASGAGCSFDAPSDQVGVENPRLTALADQGGPTSTHDLLTGSPAADAAFDALCLPDEQRGGSRPSEECDSGAVELSSTRRPTPLFLDGFLQGDAEAWSAVAP